MASGPEPSVAELWPAPMAATYMVQAGQSITSSRGHALWWAGRHLSQVIKDKRGFKRPP